ECPVTRPLSVRRLDVTTGELSTIPLGISETTENTPSGQIERNVLLHVIAADANSVWLMVENQTWKGRRGWYWGGRLIRMEISTRRAQAVTIGAYDLSGLIADGDLWLADSQHHRVLRVDPQAPRETSNAPDRYLQTRQDPDGTGPRGRTPP